jgi:hypothetical protein
MDVHAAAGRAVLRRDGNDGERRRRDGELHHFLRQGHKPDEQGILRQSALLRQGNQGAGQLHGGGTRRSAVLRRAVRHDIPGAARERTGKRKSPRHGRVHDYGLHALFQRHEGQHDALAEPVLQRQAAAVQESLLRPVRQGRRRGKCVPVFQRRCHIFPLIVHCAVQIFHQHACHHLPHESAGVPAAEQLSRLDDEQHAHGDSLLHQH